MNLGARIFESDPYLTPHYPELGTGPIPTKPYYDPAYFEAEMEKIFRKVWLIMGREGEVPNPGDYVVRNVLRSSILIVRQMDGTIKAFHNACSHRSSKLVLDEKGTAKGGFTCIFHSWRYRTDGTLSHVPDEGMFFDLDKACLGLSELKLQVWNGWILVTLNPEPEQSAVAWLGPLGERIVDYPFHEFSAVAGFETEVEGNWKVGMDAFQESFHVSGTHGGSLSKLFLSKRNPYSHVPAAELHGPHRMETVVTGGDEYKVAPAPSLVLRHGKGGATIRTQQAGMAPPGCNPASADNWAFDVFVFFPNILIDVVADGFFTHQFWPVSATRSIYQARRYYRPIGTAGQLFGQELSKAMFRDVAIEDCSTIETTQAGISSGAKQSLIFSDQELLCRHQYHVVEEYLAREEVR